MPHQLQAKYLRQALTLGAIFSKDPSTKVGCLIFNHSNQSTIARGYNGMPRNFPDHDPLLNQRPTKYQYFEHAERNALYNEAQPHLSNSLAILTHLPEPSDARALASCQIKALVCYQLSNPSPSQLIAIDILARAFIPLYTRDATPHPLSLNPYPPNISNLKNITSKNTHFLLELTQEFSTPLPNSPQSGAMFLAWDTWREITQGYGGYINKQKPISNWHEEPARNAIFNLHQKHRTFSDSTAAVSATSCIECARALIASGVPSIVCVQPTPDLESRWHQSFHDTRTLCSALNIPLSEIPLDQLSLP